MTINCPKKPSQLSQKVIYTYIYFLFWFKYSVATRLQSRRKKICVKGEFNRRGNTKKDKLQRCSSSICGSRRMRKAEESRIGWSCVWINDDDRVSAYTWKFHCVGSVCTLQHWFMCKYYEYTQWLDLCCCK